MSVKSLLKAGAAAVAFASMLAIVPATADSYSDNQRHSSYYDTGTNHSTYSRHHRAHRSESTRDMRDRDQMQSRDMSAAVQMPLAEVRDPGKVKDASVRDEDGKSVGTVRDVVLARDGELRAVKVGVGGFWGMGSKTVTIDARDLLYERDRNELTADMSKHDIDGMRS